MSDTTTLPRATLAAVPFRYKVLRRMNPLLMRLLASPLHGLMSADILVMHLTGRRSGRSYVLPLSYVEDGGALTLCTRPEGSGWWRNIGDGADVRITWRGRTRAARARVLALGSAEALDGLRRFVARNPRTGRTLYHVEAGADGRPREDDLAREVGRTVVVRVDPR